MPRRNDISKVLVIATLTLAFLIPKSAFACFHFYQPQVVGTDFTVIVTGRYGPQPNMQVTLQPNSEGRVQKSRSALTDSKGIAKFQNVPEGSYRVSSSRAQMSDFHPVEVHAATNQTTQVKLAWPSPEMLLVREIAGSINGSAGVKLEVEDIAGKSVWSGHTDEKGMFRVTSPLLPGFYRLRLVDVREEATYIPVEVNEHAKAGKIDLSLGWSSCGLSFTNLEECDRPRIQPATCGVVHDVSGGAIANATVVAFDGIHRASSTTDSEGKFTLATLASGNYEVSISAPAFTPLRARLTVDRETAVDCETPTDIELSLLGSCSSVRQRGANK